MLRIEVSLKPAVFRGGETPVGGTEWLPATGIAEAGVPRDHIAKVLNHVEGGPAATRVYDRYAYDAEKRQALERWAQAFDGYH